MAEWRRACGSCGPIVVGDFNGDDEADVMTWRNSSKSWTVHLSNGNGLDMPERKGARGSHGSILSGDFAGDGKTDVATAALDGHDTKISGGKMNTKSSIDFSRAWFFALSLSLALLVGPSVHAADRIQMVSSKDGRLEIFANTSSSDLIYHGWQTQVESGTAATHWIWMKGDTNLHGEDFVVAKDITGRLFAGAIEDGSIMLSDTAQAGAAFVPATKLATHDLQQLGLALNPDGRIEFFSIANQGGAVWSTAETAPENRVFANHNLQGINLRQLAVTPYRDGRLAVVAIGGDRSVWWIAQTMKNGDWGAWSSLGGHDIQIVTAASNADGRLEIAALGEDGGIYHRYETTSGGWSAWQILGAGKFRSPVCLVRNQDAHLEIFSRDLNSGLIQHAWQVAPNGGWSDFQVMANISALSTDFSLAMLPDGRLVLAVLDGAEDYPSVTIVGQVRANGTWTQWSGPPSKVPPKTSIVSFMATPDDGYGPIGTKFTFGWQVANCGTDCSVSLVGKTGLGNYDTVFFRADGRAPSDSVGVKPDDTNTLFVLSASGSGGSASQSKDVKLYGSSTNTCSGCSVFYDEAQSPGGLQACSKKSYYTTSQKAADDMAKSEFPAGWSIMAISATQFLAVGC